MRDRTLLASLSPHLWAGHRLAWALQALKQAVQSWPSSLGASPLGTAGPASTKHRLGSEENALAFRIAPSMMHACLRACEAMIPAIEGGTFTFSCQASLCSRGKVVLSLGSLQALQQAIQSWLRPSARPRLAALGQQGRRTSWEAR